MWRMADEPILCFDGDEAGRRAAYRAADLALPLLKPGKSLKFAALPDGQDPDDLARSGGGGAIADVLATARPLVHLLWARESEAGPLDTPERCARFEARLVAVIATIADETVRRYYRRDFAARLRQLFAPLDVPIRRGTFEAKGRRGGGFGRGRISGQVQLQPQVARHQVVRDYVAVSPHLAESPLHRGHRAAIPRREALMLQAALNHPWLLHDHLEELAAAEFRHVDTQKLKCALLDAFAQVADNFGRHNEAARAELLAELDRRGFAEVLTRIERAITTLSVWGARPGAAAADVLLTWKQLVALHTQWHSLTRELKDAELALGRENTEANYARLCDVKARLATLDGTEALVEGFGASSGRAVRSV
jgi:DNA primase